MFLDNIIKYNPGLIETGVRLHQSGRIPANTYLIDLDAVRANATLMSREAERTGVKLYAMTKQFNRNPLVAWAIVKSGIPSTVAVEMQCARFLSRYGVPVGHVGHLVPIPKHEIAHVLDMNPEVITVFNSEKAKQISDVAVEKGKVQKLLLRTRGADDIIYPNEEGGFTLEEIAPACREIGTYPGVKVVGVTTYPGVAYNEATGAGEGTENFRNMLKAVEIMRGEGVEIEQINAPGETSTKMLEVIAGIGGTHGEPGHGLLASTPWHLSEELPETPAMIYVNEISHSFGGKAYVFGGGFYVCYVTGAEGPYHRYRKSYSWTPNALVGDSPENIFDTKVAVDSKSFLGHDRNATDYLSSLHPEPGTTLKVGDTAIYGFRAQVFVSRAHVAVVSGLQNGGEPKLLGIFDKANNLLDDRFDPVQNSEAAVKELVDQL
jgi:predicted amino acid racemase